MSGFSSNEDNYNTTTRHSFNIINKIEKDHKTFNFKARNTLVINQL